MGWSDEDDITLDGFVMLESPLSSFKCQYFLYCKKVQKILKKLLILNFGSSNLTYYDSIAELVGNLPLEVNFYQPVVEMAEKLEMVEIIENATKLSYIFL